MESHKFYDLMNYPVPRNSTLYSYINEPSIWATQSEIEDTSFSRTKKCDLMNEYTDYINHWSRIFRYIPCVRQVYLCNSITFNALHANSDIDICIISRSWYIRYARLFSWLAFTLLWLKRQQGKFIDSKKRFCLSFYIDEDHSNIYHIRKRQGDVYLSYWLAHSILLYSDDILSDNHLISQNKKLLAFIPNHPPKQSIYIDTVTIRWISLYKKIWEVIICNRVGRIMQFIIESIRSGILNYKIHRLSFHTQKEIIISPYMLKFHQDKRDVIQNKRKASIRQS